MDTKEAIAAAKKYVNEVYADEQVTNLGLEEIEHILAAGNWRITLAFSRPWNTPRTRAQEVLENLGGVSSLKRSYKVAHYRRRWDGPVREGPREGGRGLNDWRGCRRRQSDGAVLLVVGTASTGAIAKHKRLRENYTIEDFELLGLIISSFSEIVLLPHILAEVSSLARQIENPARAKIQSAFPWTLVDYDRASNSKCVWRAARRIRGAWAYGCCDSLSLQHEC